MRTELGFEFFMSVCVFVCEVQKSKIDSDIDSGVCVLVSRSITRIDSTKLTKERLLVLILRATAKHNLIKAFILVL